MQTPYAPRTASFTGPLFFLLAALTACQSQGIAPTTEFVDVLIVAGQSNAVGYDAFTADLAAHSADADVRFWWRVGDPPPDDFDSTSGSREWRSLAPQPKGTPRAKDSGPRQYGNFKGADGGFGPEMGLARRLVADAPHTRLAVLKVAFSGTSLKDDWRPHPAPGDGLEVGACYRALMAETKLALAAARAEGWQPRLRGLCWIQGESDSGEAASLAYAENMRRWIAALRRDLGAPDLPVLMALNTRFGGGANQGVAVVVDAQREVASKDPRAVYVDTREATIANNAHFDAPGTLDVGRWFADALLTLEDRSLAPATQTAE